MNLSKSFYRLTSPLLKIGSGVLFLLLFISILPSFKTFPLLYLTFILEHLSEIIGLCWLYAVGYSANEISESKGITIKEFKYFQWLFVVMATCWLIALIFGTEEKSEHFSPVYYSISFPQPLSIFLPTFFISLAAYLYAIHLSAKALLTAELNRTPRIGHVGSTSVMMWVPLIGAWFIQPRIQALLRNEVNSVQ